MCQLILKNSVHRLLFYLLFRLGDDSHGLVTAGSCFIHCPISSSGTFKPFALWFLLVLPCHKYLHFLRNKYHQHQHVLPCSLQSQTHDFQYFQNVDSIGPLPSWFYILIQDFLKAKVYSHALTYVSNPSPQFLLHFVSLRTRYSLPAFIS